MIGNKDNEFLEAWYQNGQKQNVTVVQNVSVVYQLEQPITAQNMTDHQTGNQTGGLDLVPPRVIEEETPEEMLGGHQ